MIKAVLKIFESVIVELSSLICLMMIIVVPTSIMDAYQNDRPLMYLFSVLSAIGAVGAFRISRLHKQGRI